MRSADGRQLNTDQALREPGRILDEIDDLVRGASGIPWFHGKVMASSFDKPTAVELLDELRKTMPEAFKIAQDVISERERIVARARMEAEDIISRASAEAARLVAENEIAVRAKQEAAKATDEAAKYRENMIKSTNAAINGVYSQFEGIISDLLNQTRLKHKEFLERQ